jgi:hypothetical protein
MVESVSTVQPMCYYVDGSCICLAFFPLLKKLIKSKSMATFLWTSMVDLEVLISQCLNFLNYFYNTTNINYK